jgi:hypothetical protein
MSDFPSIAHFFPDFATISNSCFSLILSGNGIEGDPYVFEGLVEISDDPGNVLECRMDGLYSGGSSQGYLGVQDTPTVNLALSGDGSPAHPYLLSASPFLSPDVGNALEARANGLFATAAHSSAGAIEAAEGTCIQLTVIGGGTVADPTIISADPIISQDSGNTIECRDDGLYVQTGRDVYIFQAVGMPTPSPSSYYLWVNGAGHLYKASTNRDSWSQVNTDIKLIRYLTVVGGAVSIPYQIASLQSDGIVVSDVRTEYSLTVTSNITTWTFTGAASASTAYRHKALLVLKYDGTPRTIAWPSTWRWARKTGGLPHAAPAPSATMDVVVEFFSDDGGITQYADWDYYGVATAHP